jgi:hypothetical protein
LQELKVLCAKEMTVEGLACLTGLTELTRLLVLGSKILLESNDGYDSVFYGSAEPKYEDVALYSKVGVGSWV